MFSKVAVNVGPSAAVNIAPDKSFPYIQVEFDIDRPSVRSRVGASRRTGEEKKNRPASLFDDNPVIKMTLSRKNFARFSRHANDSLNVMM